MQYQPRLGRWGGGGGGLIRARHGPRLEITSVLCENPLQHVKRKMKNVTFLIRKKSGYWSSSLRELFEGIGKKVKIYYKINIILPWMLQSER